MKIAAGFALAALAFGSAPALASDSAPAMAPGLANEAPMLDDRTANIFPCLVSACEKEVKKLK